MKILACALGVLLCACGGAIDTTLLDGGDGGGGSDGGGGQKDGQPDVGQTSCDALYQQVQADEAAATQCCPTCNVMQCTQQVEGICCPLTVNSGDSPAVKAYESALQAFKDAHCVAACPAIACATQPSDNCMQTGTSGTCAQL